MKKIWKFAEMAGSRCFHGLSSRSITRNSKSDFPGFAL